MYYILHYNIFCVQKSIVFYWTICIINKRNTFFLNDFFIRFYYFNAKYLICKKILMIFCL